MRENMGLYHGKRVDNGEWVEGSLSTEYLKECGCVMISPTADTCYKVDPETVGQYTGLTDKNGKKIFEGDIVKAECDLYHGENKKERVTHIGTVIYDKKFCQFGINVAGFSKCYVLNRWKGDYNEVIGNIHDNPELLKGGAE